jgi:hypothetical protein
MKSKRPSFEELYARNQADAEADAESATQTGEATCPTLTLRDLLGATAQRYSGGDLALAEARSFDPPEDSFAFERDVRDLRGLADPNQVDVNQADARARIEVPVNTDSLVLCALADTLTRTPKKTPKKK